MGGGAVVFKGTEMNHFRGATSKPPRRSRHRVFLYINQTPHVLETSDSGGDDCLFGPPRSGGPNKQSGTHLILRVRVRQSYL